MSVTVPVVAADGAKSTVTLAAPVVSVAGPLFPRIGGMLVGGSHAYQNNVANIAKLDLAVLGMWPGWGPPTPAAVIASIKAVNPSILLGNYTIMTEVYSGTDSATADLRAKLYAEKGPGGVGDWWAYTSAGGHSSEYGGGTWDTNLTLLTTPDASGYHYPQWLARRDNAVEVGPLFDIWFSDNCFYRPRVADDWHRTGVNESVDSEATRTNWRNGQAAYYATANTIKPANQVLMVNADSDLNNAVYPKNGATFPQYTNIVGAAYLEKLVGQSWSVETWGSWSQMMGWYHATFNQLAAPKMVMASAQVNPTDYQTFRYFFASVLMDNGYCCMDDGSYYNVLWYDEYNLAGTASTKWLGAAIDPPQTAPWSNGVYMRRFAGGLALVNPKGNGAKTVTPPAGYKRISGSQAPTVNNGAAVTGTVTLADRDGLLLRLG